MPCGRKIGILFVGILSHFPRRPMPGFCLYPIHLGLSCEGTNRVWVFPVVSLKTKGLGGEKKQKHTHEKKNTGSGRVSGEAFIGPSLQKTNPLSSQGIQVGSREGEKWPVTSIGVGRPLIPNLTRVFLFRIWTPQMTGFPFGCKPPKKGHPQKFGPVLCLGIKLRFSWARIKTRVDEG